MNITKRDQKNTNAGNISTYSSSPKQTNGKANGRHRTNSTPPLTIIKKNSIKSSKREKGVVEKLLNSYGFVECQSNGVRVFFHYSEYEGDSNDLLIGDCLEFTLTNDPRNDKLLAVQLSKLPPGSVVMETISNEVCIGKVEVEAQARRNGEIPDPTTLGRVSYDKNGEFFFLPFTLSDVEDCEMIHKGDSVAFNIATNKRTGSLKAKRLRLASSLAKQKENEAPKTTHGIISSLKESFGFIERADIVAEIFFHYSEYNGEINELMIGDDVQFSLQNRQGKEIAVKVRKLPAGTVVFEDISPVRYKGHVIKAINQRQTSNHLDGHLTGVIEFQGETDTHEVLFGDRDMEDDIILQKGDVVEFNVSTDRRDKLERAVHIKLISVCLKEGQKRDVGVIVSIKEGFGFIKCADEDLSVFFHFSEVLEQSHIINVGDEVEFTIELDQISRRQHATRIRFLPKGSVTFESISTKRHIGIVDQEAPERNLRSPSKQNKEQEYGIIKSFLNGEETDVYYRLRDCQPREQPRYRDKVEFILVTKKSTNQKYARDITVAEAHVGSFVRGYICALKEKFGFIESEDQEREVFFHYSEFDGDPNDLELGDEVQYMEAKKTEKTSAERVSKVNSNGALNTSILLKDNVLPDVHEGVIVAPFATDDVENVEGFVQIVKDNNWGADCDEREAIMKSNECTYTFDFSSLLEKKESLTAGSRVRFQLLKDENGEVIKAVNVSTIKSEKTGKVDSVKGQFGFISYDEEAEERKSIFFHMSQVLDDHGVEIQVGDEVLFTIVRSHKNAKKSAIRVHRKSKETPEHLRRRRSKRFSESQNNNNKFCVTRQPSGPDGTTGFKFDRCLDEENDVFQQLTTLNTVECKDEA